MSIFFSTKQGKETVTITNKNNSKFTIPTEYYKKLWKNNLLKRK